MKRVEEGYLEFLPKTYAAGLQACGRQDIDGSNNERVEVEGSSPEYFSLSLERGDPGLSTQARGE